MRKMECEKMFLLAAIIIIFIVVEGRNVSTKDMEVKKLLKHRKPIIKRAVKTIKSEDDDIIDCVDIYKQPAFDHPLLKNHKIQMWPSDYTEEYKKKSNASSPILSQIWRKSGTCPDGTVPIRRIQKSDIRKAPSWDRLGMEDVEDYVERSILAIEKGKFYGVSATLNTWNMHVQPHEISLTSVNVISTDLDDERPSIIRAGWLVSDRVYKDRNTRFFTYWSTWDGGHSSGCYDHTCPGFILTNKDVSLGSQISPLSIYWGDQNAVTFSIALDRKFNNWWLRADDVPVGYWPCAILKNMTVASTVTVGGEVTYGLSRTRVREPHSSTQMGSGHYSHEGFRKAAFVGNVLYRGEDGKDHQPQDAGSSSSLIADNIYCYDNIESTGQPFPSPTPGYSFFYGGSGVGENCMGS